MLIVATEASQASAAKTVSRCQERGDRAIGRARAALAHGGGPSGGQTALSRNTKRSGDLAHLLAIGLALGAISALLLGRPKGFFRTSSSRFSACRSPRDTVTPFPPPGARGTPRSSASLSSVSSHVAPRELRIQARGHAAAVRLGVRRPSSRSWRRQFEWCRGGPGSQGRSRPEEGVAALGRRQNTLARMRG